MKKVKRIILITLVICVITDGCKAQKQRPDIIYIITDQQSETMMSCAGNRYLKTPAMDYIANNDSKQ